MAGPLVSNLPLHVLQQTVAASKSHGFIYAQSYCAIRGNITFSLAKEILFLQTQTAFIECTERGWGSQRGAGCVRDGCSHPRLHMKFKWASFAKS